MFSIRTDLAEELRTHAMTMRAKEKAGDIDGVLYNERTEDFIKISTIEITNETGEKTLGKPKGRYVTISFPTAANLSYRDFITLCDTVSVELRAFCWDYSHTLVCGIGNRELSADALGVLAAENVLVTHHLKRMDGVPLGMSGFGDVSAFSPGTMANTGAESAELIHSVVDKLRPDAVIAIDALAARDASRLARTIQISDTGIAPGSGIGNRREALNAETLGIPVIAIGVPTVVDTATLLRDALEGRSPNENILRSLSGLFVAPKEIDEIASNMARLIGYALNRTLHGDFPYEEMAMMA
ncbi:MAG: GPR endopeptidase [Clostridia bacterium]|nr:GPR endopeptidase [Clostridia bacterium]